MMPSSQMPDSTIPSLLEVLPVGLLVFDDNGTIHDVNSTLLKWLGESHDELISQHLDRILPAGGRIFYQTHFFPLLRASGNVSELYFALRRHDGKELPVLLNATRQVLDGVSRNVAAIVVINDRQQFEGALLQAWHMEQAAREELEQKSRELNELNAKLREQNAELTATEERLRQSNESKDEFVGLISHELKNPLTTLTGTFAILRRTLGTRPIEENQAFIAELHTEFTRLISVTENLLVIARSEMTAVEDIEPIVISHIVRSVVARHASLQPGRKIEIHIEPQALLALASAALTEQILDNFLSNATKYGVEGGAVEIKVGRISDRVTITVSNEGEQLTPTEVHRFFQPFYRGTRNPKKAPGVGLGLTVCQRLAEAQKGSISASPRPGGGLEVTVSLPALEEEESPVSDTSKAMD